MSTLKKILIVTPRIHNNLRGWHEALQESGARISYVAEWRSANDASSVSPDYVLEELRGGRRKISSSNRQPSLKRGPGLGLLGDWFASFQILRSERADIVIVRDLRRVSLIFLWVARLWFGTPTVVYSQIPSHVLAKATAWERLRLSLQSLRILVLSLGSPVISPVKFRKSTQNHPQIVRGRKRITFIPFAVSAQTQRKGKGEQTLRIISIGKFQPYKNHMTTLIGLKLLSDGARDFSATIIGQASSEADYGLLRDLKVFAASLGITDRVQFEVNLSYEEIQSHMANNDVFVLSSFNEVASVAVVESLAFGLVPVATEENGSNCYFSETGCGFTFCPSSPTQLAATLDRLTDRGLLERMRENAVPLKAEIDPKRVSQYWTDFFETL